LNGESAETRERLEAAYKADGIQGFWRQRIEQLKSRGGYIEPLTIADFYIRLGDKDQAFAWLEKGYQEHNPFMVGLRSTSRVDPIRSDPRYADLVRRVGLV